MGVRSSSHPAGSTSTENRDNARWSTSSTSPDLLRQLILAVERHTMAVSGPAPRGEDDAAADPRRGGRRATRPQAPPAALSTSRTQAPAPRRRTGISLARGPHASSPSHERSLRIVERPRRDLLGRSWSRRRAPGSSCGRARGAVKSSRARGDPVGPSTRNVRPNRSTRIGANPVAPCTTLEQQVRHHLVTARGQRVGAARARRRRARRPRLSATPSSAAARRRRGAAPRPSRPRRPRRAEHHREVGTGGELRGGAWDSTARARRKAGAITRLRGVWFA